MRGNLQKTIRPTMTRKGRKLSVSGKKRTGYVGAKVTPAQKEHFDRLAAQCEMTTSGYVLARAYNYEPKARMSPEELSIFQGLSEFSRNVKHFFANYDSFTESERARLVKTYPFVAKWLGEIKKEQIQIAPYIKRLTEDNPIPE